VGPFTSNNVLAIQRNGAREAFFRTKKIDPTPQRVLEQYLHSTSDELCSIAAWPQLK